MDNPALPRLPDHIFGTPVQPVTLDVPSHISHTCRCTAASLRHVREVGVRTAMGSSVAPRHDAAALGSRKTREWGQPLWPEGAQAPHANDQRTVCHKETPLPKSSFRNVDFPVTHEMW